MKNEKKHPSVVLEKILRRSDRDFS